METPRQESPSPSANLGEPRSGDVAITVLTAMILLFVLLVVAAL